MAHLDIGPTVDGGEVETALRAMLEEWVPFYLSRIDVRDGRAAGDTLPPRRYDVSSEYEAWAERLKPPSLIVVSPGTLGEPELHGERASYAAWWQANIGVAVGGATEAGTRALAHRHALAVRLAIAQQGDLGVDALTRWKGERYDLVGRERTRMACEVLAHVRLGRVVDTRGLIPRAAPDDPTDPPLDTPTPVGTRVVVTRRS